MQPQWLKPLKTSPIPALLCSGDQAVAYFTSRDLLNQQTAPITTVWGLPQVQRLLCKQQPDGSWRHSGKKAVTYPKNHYELVETWKTIRHLVERYQLTQQHPAVAKAAEYLFSFQTSEGDIRGMLANQYATYYTGAMLSVLIKAGYADDIRVEKGLQWLLSMRQNDGGWTIPLLSSGLSQATINHLTSFYAEPVQPDPTKPFSHNWTDMALRALAVHPTYRKSKEARVAAELLKSSFFKSDYYPSYQDAGYWLRFMFWWPNLVTGLEVLLQMGYKGGDEDVQKGLNWLAQNQLPTGLWLLDYKSKRTQDKKNLPEQFWLALRVAKIFKGFNS